MIGDRSLLLPGVLMAAVSLVGIAVILLWREAARRDLEVRVTRVVAGERTRGDAAAAPGPNAFAGMLRTLGEGIRTRTRLYSEDDLAAIEGMLLAAGAQPKNLLPVVLGAKIVALFLVPLTAVGITALLDVAARTRLMVLAISLVFGVLGPEWFLRALRGSYVKSLRRGAADAIDLLVVCTEAGMGLESGLEQVAREIGYSNRAMSIALLRLLDELKVLPDRRDALNNFGRRSGVPALRRTSAILVQSLQYGTPLGQALRAVAVEVRRERALRLEEKAVRLPALLVFPLVMFILPALFIVMGGSSFLRLFEALSMFSGHHH